MQAQNGVAAAQAIWSPANNVTFANFEGLASVAKVLYNTYLTTRSGTAAPSVGVGSITGEYVGIMS